MRLPRKLHLDHVHLVVEHPVVAAGHLPAVALPGAFHAEEALVVAQGTDRCGVDRAGPQRPTGLAPAAGG